MSLFYRLLFAVLCVVFASNKVNAQNKLIQDYNRVMEIPAVIATEASPSHLYVLSEQEGMAVFRTYSDSLQWLYTSSGMQRRGSQLLADIRFAYLFGSSRRLTVLEPTSVLGVYSSTILPSQPKSAARIDNQLYIALAERGIGSVSLETPESVDSELQFVAEEEINSASVLDLKSSDFSKQLFVLTGNSELLIFNKANQSLSLSSRISLTQQIEHIFIDEEQVWGSTADGRFFEINDSGLGRRIGDIGEPVSEILSWNNRIFVRGSSGKIWTTGPGSGSLSLWKNDGAAGNYITDSGNRLWISENNKLSEVLQDSPGSELAAEASGPFKLKSIPNQVLTFPNPLIIAANLEGNYPAGQVEFAFRSNVKNATMKKQGLVWQPTVNQMGTHWFTIIATNAKGKVDSTRFTVDVRSFNSPPRFSPVRTTSIAVNEQYTFQFRAIDPENPSGKLIRYIGVDLPEGSSINESTGQFSWTPTERQVGESTFKVIATDKLGAASSIDVTLNVLDISRGEQD